MKPFVGNCFGLCNMSFAALSHVLEARRRFALGDFSTPNYSIDSSSPSGMLKLAHQDAIHFSRRHASSPARIGRMVHATSKVTLFLTSISHHKKMITTIILFKSIFCKENSKKKKHLHDFTLILTPRILDISGILLSMLDSFHII